MHGLWPFTCGKLAGVLELGVFKAALDERTSDLTSRLKLDVPGVAEFLLAQHANLERVGHLMVRLEQCTPTLANQ